MTNQARGAHTFEADGKTYTLFFDMNSLADLEDAMGVKLPQIVERIEAGEMGIKEVRALLWAGLLHEHEELTIREAGQLFTQGGMNQVIEAVVKAFTAAFGDAEKQVGKRGNVPKKVK